MAVAKKRSSDLGNQIRDTEGLYIKPEVYMYLSDLNDRFVDLWCILSVSEKSFWSTCAVTVFSR